MPVTPQDGVAATVVSLRADPKRAGGAIVTLAPLDDGRPLVCFCVPWTDAHALSHELRGDVTIRTRTITLLRDCLQRCRARILATWIVRAGPDEIEGAVEIATPHGMASTPAAPAEAIVLAAALDVPLLMDPSLLPAQGPAAAGGGDSPETSGVPASVAAFLQTLDLALPGDPHAEVLE